MKKISIFTAIIFAISAIALVACTTTTTYTISIDDVTCTAEGNKLTVDLIGNPSTGYEWTVSLDEDSLLKDTGYTSENVDSDDEGLDGAPIKETYTFEASGTGKTYLYADFARSWEETEDDRSYAFLITVDEGQIRKVESMDGPTVADLINEATNIFDMSDDSLDEEAFEDESF